MYIFIIKKDGELVIVDIYIHDFALRLRSVNVLEWLKD